MPALGIVDRFKLKWIDNPRSHDVSRNLMCADICVGYIVADTKPQVPIWVCHAVVEHGVAKSSFRSREDAKFWVTDTARTTLVLALGAGRVAVHSPLLPPTDDNRIRELEALLAAERETNSGLAWDLAREIDRYEELRKLSIVGMERARVSSSAMAPPPHPLTESNLQRVRTYFGTCGDRVVPASEVARALGMETRVALGCCSRLLTTGAIRRAKMSHYMASPELVRTARAAS